MVLDPRRPIDGLADSKRLSAARRERLAVQIRESALCWGLGRAEVAEIDRLNILQASLLAMRRAVAALGVVPGLALVDGNQDPQLSCPVRTIVGGDGLEPAIAAASILAKVARDEMMVRLDERYPGYGFSSHKGYPTRNHVGRLKVLGPTPVHRRSFRPVAELVRAP